MNEEIQRYVNEQFSNAPKKQSVTEMKEALLADLKEHFDELISQGKNEKEAFDIVISGIGDLQALIAEMAGPQKTRKPRRERVGAIVMGLAVIVGVGLFFLFQALHLAVLSQISLSLMLAACITMLLITFGFGESHSSKEKSTPRTEGESFVEEYKVNIHRPGKATRMRSAASGLLWTLTTIVYFLLSFGTGQWQLTWVAFPIAVVLQQVISSLLSNDHTFFHSGILYTTAAIIYLEISFYTHAWHITWLIFLFAVVVSQAIRLIKASRDPE